MYIFLILKYIFNCQRMSDMCPLLRGPRNTESVLSQYIERKVCKTRGRKEKVVLDLIWDFA